VQNYSVLTIRAGKSLNIDFAHQTSGKIRQGYFDKTWRKNSLNIPKKIKKLGIF
jgi:hypothetical protein